MTNLSKTFFFVLLVFTYSNLWSQIQFKHVIVDSNAPRNLWGKSIGDINGDGYQDLLAGGNSSDGLVWYQNPNWTKHIISKDATETDIETADIDNDGKLDVVAIGTNKLQWYKSPDWTRSIIDPNISLHDIEVADFNSDGKIDIVGRDQEYGHNSGDTIHIYLQGNSSSNWLHLTFPAPKGEGLKVFDVNDDDKLDIIIGGVWYENSGDMNNWTSHTFSTAWNYHHVYVATGDINGDGKADIILSPSEKAGDYYKIAWYEHPTDPSSDWQEHLIVDQVETVHHFVGAADFNNDGKIDIATAEMQQGADPDEVSIYINQDNGTNWEKQVLATTGSHNMRIIDIDNDGDWDLYGGNWNGPGKAELWVNESLNNDTVIPSGLLDTWERHIIDPEKEWRTIFLDSKDLNGDGLKDIITGGWWYKNPGSAGGIWTKHTIGSPLYNMAFVYDFDGDGDMDILGTEGKGANYNAKFVWAQNDGDGKFTIWDNIKKAEGDFLQGVAVVRKNKEFPYKVALSWHTSGYGVQTLTVPDDPANNIWTWEKISEISQDECLTSGDIDRDGTPDLLMGTKWLKDSNGVWSLNTLFETSDLPDRNKLADINQDGRLDAVVGYQAISVLGKLVWYEQPDTATNTWKEHLIANVIGPMSMDAVDMDGDSDIDVVVGEHYLSRPDSAKMLIFENLNGKGTTWMEHKVYQGDESHDGAVTVDIDNDGDLDILTIGWGHNKVLLYENKRINTNTSYDPTPIPSKSLMVYPNPAHYQITIALSLPMETKIKTAMYNLTGKVIFSEQEKQPQTNSFHKVIPVSHLASGTYILRLQTNDKIYAKKFAIVNE